MWTGKFLNPERKCCGLKNIRIRVDGALSGGTLKSYKSKRICSIARKFGHCLQSWTKVLGQICTFGHTSDAITSSPVLPRSSTPLPPYNVENYYLQFLMIFNIVLEGRGKRNVFLKGKPRFFQTSVVKHR